MSSDSAGLTYPVQCLTFIRNYAIASAGPELYIYVIPDLCVLSLKREQYHSTNPYPSLDEPITLKRPVIQGGSRAAISHVAVDHDAKHLVTISIEDKHLNVWALNDLSLLSSR